MINNNKTNKTTNNKKVYDENAIYNHVLTSQLPIENIIHYINTRKILKAKYNKYNKLDYIDTTPLDPGYLVLVKNDTQQDSLWVLYSLTTTKTWAIERVQQRSCH